MNIENIKKFCNAFGLKPNVDWSNNKWSKIK